MAGWGRRKQSQVRDRWVPLRLAGRSPPECSVLPRALGVMTRGLELALSCTGSYLGILSDWALRAGRRKRRQKLAPAHSGL